jgi:hypothetical protein
MVVFQMAKSKMTAITIQKSDNFLGFWLVTKLDCFIHESIIKIIFFWIKRPRIVVKSEPVQFLNSLKLNGQ